MEVLLNNILKNEVLFLALALLGAWLIGYWSKGWLRKNAAADGVDASANIDGNANAVVGGNLEKLEGEKNEALQLAAKYKKESIGLSTEIDGLKRKLSTASTGAISAGSATNVSNQDYDILELKYNKLKRDLKKSEDDLARCEAKVKSGASKPAAKPRAAAPRKTASKTASRTAFTGYSAKDKDDLKQISGVGPKMEKMLNKMGIWSFKQISEFRAADLTKIDDNLDSFQGRAKRDDWIGQAKKLFKNK